MSASADGAGVWVRNWGRSNDIHEGKKEMRKKSVKEYAVEVVYIIGGALMMAAWVVAMWAVSGQSYNIH